MKVDSVFTKDLTIDNIFDQLEWKQFDVSLKDHRSNKILFELNGIEAPSHWSQQTVDIMASKYFRRSGVPSKTKRENRLPENVSISKKDAKNIPEWLLPSLSDEEEGTDLKNCGETSVKQVFHRLAGTWTFWGWISGFFKGENGENSEEYAANFYKEAIYCLYHQLAAPNSPQFFNTGIWWAYGIEGKPCGHSYADKNGKIYRSKDLFSRSQAHACFILGLEDNLLEKDGIYDLLKKEARIFKLGSGSGTNFSNLRAEGEHLSGGGTSSGLLSFLRIFDRAADCIKSGGVTRRAAKLLSVDIDHPDIVDFIKWKSHEEEKAKALIAAGYESDFNGEAYKTVSGQNGNNSVSISHDFMKALDADDDWNMWWVLDKQKYQDKNKNISLHDLKENCKPAKTLKAKHIWDTIIDSAWKCADPAIHFNGIMNDWNTLASDGKIRSTNPCSEFVAIDNQACNLASINLVKFIDNNKQIQIENYKHVIRLWQIILEITNFMAQLPSEEVSRNVWKYRNTGLGPANLGTLLMLMGYSYDSDEGLSIGSSLMSIMTGHSYAVSAEMANHLGPFQGYDRNRDHMIRAVKNHRRAAYGLTENLEPMRYRELSKQVGKYEKLEIHPIPLSDKESYGQSINNLVFEARKTWDEALSVGSSFGFRNAQVTVCAPTGTISFIMGCDSTGIEPSYALVSYKTLAGGGIMKIVNGSVKKTLINLGYEEDQIKAICKFIEENGHVKGAGIRQEHESIFKCAASPLGDEGIVNWKGHIKMLAALQAFVSGAISKTINMPENSTKEDISEALKMGYKLGCKGISVYRDNCKGSAPLQTKREDLISSEDTARRITDDVLINELGRRKTENSIDVNGVLEKLGITHQDIVETKKNWGQRRRPGHVVPGMRFRIKIGQAQGYVQMFLYPDGKMCEFFLTFGNPGSSLNNMLECWSIAFSIALQRGESLYNLCTKFIGVEFEPKGFTGRQDDLRKVTSPVDYIARLMLMHFDDEGYIKDKSLFKSMVAQNNLEFKPEESVVIKEDISKDEPSDDTSFNFSRPPCPKCGSLMTSGTDKCPSCPVCGYFGGCG